MAEEVELAPAPFVEERAEEDGHVPSIQRRLDKTKFVSMVKAHTRPGRPAYAALARAVGKMLGIGITLAEPIKCVCGKSFVPWAKSQTHCSTACSNRERQRRYRLNKSTPEAK